MIVPPVRNWYVIRLFGSIRGTKFGSNLFGSVCGPKTWYDVIWLGPRSVIFPCQFGTNYTNTAVRIFFDQAFISIPYQCSNSYRYSCIWFGTIIHGMLQVAISSQPIRVFIKVIEYFGTNKGGGCQIKVLYLDQFSKLISIERRQKK